MKLYLGVLVASLFCCLAPRVVAEPMLKTYFNDEYGIGMNFPAGSTVCQSRSGDHARGFFAWYGSALSCRDSDEFPKDGSSSAISVYADYNTNFETSAKAELDDNCQTRGFQQVISSAEWDRLTIPGHATIKCAVKNSDGTIVIDVVAQGGQWRETDGSPKVPYIFYNASLFTHASRIKHDLPMFEAFLKGVIISSRQPNS